MNAHDVARALPEISVLRDRCRSLAVLDAVMSPQWDMRYYSFDSHWGPDEEMASMRDGSGGEWSIVFAPGGVFFRGFDHESEMSPYANEGRLWPGLIDDLPGVFAACAAEPAFSDGAMLLATACLWREAEDGRWHAGDLTFPPGDDPDGADWLFELLVDGTPAGYQRFAEHYYERQLDADAVSAIFALQPLTVELVQRLNPEVTLDDLADDLSAVGYSPGG